MRRESALRDEARPVRSAGRVLLTAALTLAACKDSASHIYAARRYDPSRKCVDPTTSIDVVDGDEPGASCAPVCLVSPPTTQGERTIYVSKECPPYPPLFDTSGKSAECPNALATYAAAISCAGDAGIVDSGQH